ncbi:hypothetical protein K0U07_03565 [bacterium]|nr:hypothetical protein [bacterium]
MYTPEEIRISHPTTFDKCLLKKENQDSHLPCREKEHMVEPKSSSIISYINSILPLAGTLKETDQGYLYLDIANEYITSIIPFFEDPSVDLPPYYEGTFRDGAHISIATPEEEKKLFSPLPIGEAFSFSITGCFRAKLLFDIENKYVWYFTISSEELTSLRTSVGLSPLPNGESFYITLAYKKTFLSLNDLITDAGQSRISLSESAILLNKLRNLE